jgi:hypothetical protein
VSRGIVRWILFASVEEPATLDDALASTNWKEAMDAEYGALMVNKTWKLVPPRHGTNIIDCRCIYKVKRKSDGSIDRYKARLVAKGFKQRVIVLITRIPSVQLLKLLLFDLFYLLLFQEDGVCDS